MQYLILAIIPIVFILVAVPLPKPARYGLVLTFAVCLSTALWPNFSREYRLEKEGWHTAGVITDKNCEKRATSIAYKFEVNGKSYIGSMRDRRTCVAGPAVGDQVLVTYMVADPSINAPRASVSAPVFLMILLLIGCVVGLLWANHSVSRKKQTTKARKKTS